MIGRGRRKRDQVEQDRKEMLRLYTKLDYTVAAIAARLHYSRTQVYAYIKEVQEEMIVTNLEHEDNDGKYNGPEEPEDLDECYPVGPPPLNEGEGPLLGGW